jgi:DNA-binding GntR family transcriptional regulator/anti-sigma regulatory factor (Ser/Thr protein kinase)
MAEPRGSRTERAYQYLTEEILGGRWQPAEILSTYALAEELRVSRTPILEALKRLESDGLVEIIPQVGCRIVPLTADAVEEMFAIRGALEGAAAAAAARRVGEDLLTELELTLRRLDDAAERGDLAAHAELNQRFHLTVAEASGMPRLAEKLRSVGAQLRYQLSRLTITDRQLRGSALEHRELVEALRRGSERRARAAAERHAQLSADRFLSGLGPVVAGPLRHRALIYGSVDEFLTSTVPFIEQGLAAGERVLAVTTSENADALGRALGARADEVEFRDSHEWYLLPSHTLLSYERYVEAAERSRVRVIGEVAWNGDSTAPMSEWTRYESIINGVFAREPVSFICPYDARALPAPIVTAARRTHPELCVGADVVPSEDYVACVDLVSELDRGDFKKPPRRAAQRTITRDLRDVRGFILDQARDAGVAGKALQDTFLAVQELAANVIVNGNGHATVRSWIKGSDLIYEITDPGAGLGDPLLGQLRSDCTGLSELTGLSMARLLCDLVEVRISDRGLIVRVRVSLA